MCWSDDFPLHNITGRALGLLAAISVDVSSCNGKVNFAIASSRCMRPMRERVSSYCCIFVSVAWMADGATPQLNNESCGRVESHAGPRQSLIDGAMCAVMFDVVCLCGEMLRGFEGFSCSSGISQDEAEDASQIRGLRMFSIRAEGPLEDELACHVEEPSRRQASDEM